MTVQRCFTDTILANHATKSVCEWLDLRIVFWGAELAWPSNHFRRRTVLHTCRGNVNNTRACFDWQATQTLLFALSRITFLDLSCVRCVIQNTEVLRSCVRCVFQNAHLQLNFKIRKLPSCENGQRLFKWLYIVITLIKTGAWIFSRVILWGQGTWGHFEVHVHSGHCSLKKCYSYLYIFVCLHL